MALHFWPKLYKSAVICQWLSHFNVSISKNTNTCLTFNLPLVKFAVGITAVIEKT
nr:hypothetical protein Iba_chr08dCG15250 [Ipomoea batatas]GMD28807.1 hypothetical protein Iba_chr08eCG10800 [Ipomoea batatas]